MAKLTNTETGVKLAVPVSQKISLGIMMLGAFAALFGIALGMSYQLPINKKNPPPIVRPVPLLVSEVNSGVLDHTENHDVGLTLQRNSILMADSNLQNGLFSKRAILEGSKAPLYLDLNNKEATQVSLDAHLISAELVDLNQQTFNLTLCFPAVNLESEQVLSYYYDTNGTPYKDVLLTQMATTKPCNQLLANSLLVSEVNSGVLDHTENHDVGLTLQRNSILMADSNLQSGLFSKRAILEGSKAPLYLDLNNKEATQVSLDAHLISAELVDLNQQTFNLTLCFPAVNLESEQVLSYYYDTNGTPYKDVLLTQMATTKPCNQLLANSLLVSEVNSGVLDHTENHDVGLTLQRNSILMADSNLQSGLFSKRAILEGSKAPLYLDLNNKEATQVSLDAHLISAELVDLNQQTFNLTLCFPAVNLESEQVLSYYYDTNGTPYKDVLLTQMATTKPCNQLLANSLLVSEVNSGVLDHTENHDVGLTLQRNSILMADSNLQSGLFSKRAILEGSKAPLYLDLNNKEATQVSLDAHLISAELVDLNQQTFNLTLCFPAVNLESEQVLSYYYDTNGTPYRDVLLTQMATTKPCNQLLANSLLVSEVNSGVLDHTENHDVGLTLQRNSILMADSNLQSGLFSKRAILEGSKAPLYLDLNNKEATQVSLDAHLISAEFVDLNQQTFNLTLCFPAVNLESEQVLSYYYDTNGTPYKDVLLTQMATTKACNELLANAYIPKDLTSGRLSQAYPSAPPHFQIYAVRDDHTMGWWENDANTFYCGDESIITAPDENSKTPLALSMGQAGDPAQNVAFSLPSRGLVLESNVGTIQLCLPAVNIKAGGHAIYYYDKDGKPYSDLLLEKAVSCEIPPKTTNTNTSIPTQTE